MSDEDEELGYITESVSEITPAISMHIIIIVLSIIVALIFAAKILFFEKRRNPERPSPEDGLKTMCLYLICVILLATGLYGAGTAARIIYMILVALSIFLLCIALVYVFLNRNAIIYKIGTSGPFFKQIFDNIAFYGGIIGEIIKGLFIQSDDVKLFGIATWLTSKTTSTTFAFKIIYQYPIMFLKMIIQIIMTMILIPFLLIYIIGFCIATVLLAIWSGFVSAYKWIMTGTTTMKDRFNSFKSMFSSGKKKGEEVDLDEQANLTKTGKLIPDNNESNETVNKSIELQDVELENVEDKQKPIKKNKGFFDFSNSKYNDEHKAKLQASHETKILTETDTLNPLNK